MSHQNNKELSHEARVLLHRFFNNKHFGAAASNDAERSRQAGMMDGDNVPNYEHELTEEQWQLLRDNNLLSSSNQKPENVGVHHLEVPFGPEGYLIAHHLYQGLKDQGVSMELGDGTYVRPEALDAVLSGPDGFGDWKSTKFVIVLPVSEPIKTKAAELNALQEEATQASIALEEAQQRMADALNQLNAATGANKVKAGVSDYSAGMTPSSSKTSRSFAELTRDSVPFVKPATQRTENLRRMAKMSLDELRRALTHCRDECQELCGLADIEMDAALKAIETGRLSRISANGEIYTTIVDGPSAEIPPNANFFRLLIWDKGYIPTWSGDLRPEEAKRLMASFVNIQKETRGYMGGLPTTMSAAERLLALSFRKAVVDIAEYGIDAFAKRFGLNEIEKKAFEEIANGNCVHIQGESNFTITTPQRNDAADKCVLSAVTWEESYTPTWLRKTEG